MEKITANDVVQYLKSRRNNSASYQEIAREFYEANPNPDSVMVDFLRELIDEGRVEQFWSSFEGEVQNHFRLVQI